MFFPVNSHAHASSPRQVGIVCNDAQILEGILMGQPTEGAIVACAIKVTVPRIPSAFSPLYFPRIVYKKYHLHGISALCVDGNGLGATSLQASSRDAVQFGQQVHDSDGDGSRQTSSRTHLRQGSCRASAQNVQQVQTHFASNNFLCVWSSFMC